ncbi:MAG: T9SS type A sorting domain-containing protein [Flavisolibacter sp.]|nr:T9SS type A sorting domain-containing protein [Flavisolibacter sp.]
MKKFYIILFLILISNISSAQIITFADPVLKSVLVGQTCASFDDPISYMDGDVDINDDGEIQESEAAMVIGLNLSGQNITSLDGLEYFTNVVWLRCNNNSITSIDLSWMNTNLPSMFLWLIDVSDNPLTLLILPQPRILSLGISNTLLESIVLGEMLNGDESMLIISNNPNLQTIDAKNGTTESNIQGNSLELIIENNPLLATICVDDVSYYNFLSQEWESESGHWAEATGFNPNIMITSYCDFTPGGDYNAITGNVVLDCGGSNQSVNFLPIFITQGSQNSTTYTTDGNFITYSTLGNITIAPQLQNPSIFTITPSQFSYNFTTPLEQATVDFCISAIGFHPDVEVTIFPITQAVPGFNTTYRLIVRNVGNQPASGLATLSFNDSLLDYISSTPNGSQLGNVLSWSFNDLMPFDTFAPVVTINLNSPMENPPLNNGDNLTFEASAEYVGDETLENNSSQLIQTLVNSFDPNDKTCLEGNTVGPEMIGKFVHYMIRFENTGTFPARNIVVKDIIDTTKFDVATLIPISGSHSFETRITETNKVEFIFENIQLPFDDANNDGYVAFKIKTKPTLVVGSTFSNSASIYFDYNFPIVTNTATTTIQQLGTNDFEFSNYITLFPNPSKNFLNVKMKDSLQISSLSIFNALGQLVMVVTDPSLGDSIDVSKLNSGNYFIKVSSELGTANSQFIKE